MSNKLRILAAVPGVPMLFNGLGFVATPDVAAESLGMQMLTGIGLSTQIGDMISFFLGIAAMIFLGAYKCQRQWLYAAAMFLGLAALGRVIASAVHGADLAVQLIGAEVILTVWLALVGFYMSKDSGKN